MTTASKAKAIAQTLPSRKLGIRSQAPALERLTAYCEHMSFNAIMNELDMVAIDAGAPVRLVERIEVARLRYEDADNDPRAKRGLMLFVSNLMLQAHGLFAHDRKAFRR